jgi:hypothetical protein
VQEQNKKSPFSVVKPVPHMRGSVGEPQLIPTHLAAGSFRSFDASSATAIPSDNSVLRNSRGLASSNHAATGNSHIDSISCAACGTIAVDNIHTILLEPADVAVINREIHSFSVSCIHCYPLP